MKSIVSAGVIFFTLITQPYLIFGSELMSTADEFDTGGWRITAYGSNSKTKPVFEISNVDAIQVPVSGGSSTIFSKSDSKHEMESEQTSAVAAITFRPKDGLHYRIKIGQIQNYTLEYSSGSLTNKFENRSSGYVWGVGARLNLTQGTMVGPAVAIDFGYTQTQIEFDRFQSGDEVINISQTFTQDEIQVAANISRKWGKLEPFGGLKMMRIEFQLRDNNTKGKIKGVRNGVSPFLGLSWEFFPGESLIVEGSVLDEESLSAGVNIRFQ